MSETSPLEGLAESVLAEQASREANEETLRTVPRWRFRRRRDLEKTLRRRRQWERGLEQALVCSERRAG